MTLIKWRDIYARVRERVERSDLLYFRGHADASWKLLPRIGRFKIANLQTVERIAYYDFVTRAGTLISAHASSWDIAFAMQHHGVPTRLLDWSDAFGVALYFALKDAVSDAAVWILDPFALNKTLADTSTLPRPEQLEHDYADCFIDDQFEFDHKAVAIAPLRHHPRMFSQRSGFTLHGTVAAPLERLCPRAVEKIIIPRAAQDDARSFLALAGTSEFSIFPDLDGLGREIRVEHFGDDGLPT